MTSRKAVSGEGFYWLVNKIFGLETLYIILGCVKVGRTSLCCPDSVGWT